MKVRLSAAQCCASVLVVLSFLAVSEAVRAEPRGAATTTLDLSLPPPTEHFAAPEAPGVASPESGEAASGNLLERPLEIGPGLQVNPEMREPNEYDLTDPSRPNRTLEPQIRLRVPL
ncbi:MAG TPA: hypothetical protein VJ924_08465 [Alphaproteobacteria bacterium]|nr:hypothetical protein [Alphaproteobacteria bacterium]